MKKIKVMIVDDSAFVRQMLSKMLSSDPDIDVVGTAMDGVFALEKIQKLRPDVVTLDINMPRMDGIETLERIMEDFGTQVIIVSSHTRKNADLSIQALEIGAFDLVSKPDKALSDEIINIDKELVKKIKEACRSPLARSIMKTPAAPVIEEEGTLIYDPGSSDRVLAIGISTGGPNALNYMLPQLPKGFPAGILIVQHMPEGFIDMFASRLNKICQIDVKVASHDDLIVNGRALLAPGGKHLKVRKRRLGTTVSLDSSPPESGHRPSADVLFRSVAECYGKKASGLIMTGMGHDGSDGIGDIMRKGGYTIAQEERSCVVFGMPKVAIEKGNISNIVPLEDMASFLVKQFDGKGVANDKVGS